MKWRWVALLSALSSMSAVSFAVVLNEPWRDAPADTNWYCGDPEDVAWGGQVIVVRCREYESMLDANDGVEPLAEMDLWINADGLNSALQEAQS